MNNLVERLNAMVIPSHKSWPTHYRNPDGPEAASRISQLEEYAREASKALMRLSGGGSEMFRRIGDEFYAEPDLCVERAEHRIETIRKIYETRQALGSPTK